AIAGASLAGFAFSGRLWVAMPLIYLTGMGIMLTAASTNTVLQTVVEDRLRARVAAIYMMAFVGMSPLGALAAGSLAHYTGAPATLAIGGLLAIAAAAAYVRKLPAIRREIRPVYERLGIVAK
ncbi:MAG TPA: MFS transporter, partial [Burkholderiales bacterium]|nr:MFS transporter [Burkholderiales bacterium]